MTHLERIERQNAAEANGAWAGLCGKTREDCPHDLVTEPELWNFWVYGCESARGELLLIRGGYVHFYTEAENWIPNETLPVREAIASGRWAPKWANPSFIESRRRRA